MQRSLLPLVLLLASCTAKVDPPGYKGPLPSAAGQTAMKDLVGKPLKDTAGNEWIVKWFAVVPNDGSPGGVGPAVEVERGGVRKHIPVESDGDAADLYRRVTGAPHPTLAGSPGKPYSDAVSRLR